MPTTLYINAPDEKADNEEKKSYKDTLQTAIGIGYAIPKDDAARCRPGCIVVLLCQDGRLRAEGKLKMLSPTGEKTGSGMLRYDVHMEELKQGPYSPPPAPLRRTGILVVSS